MLYRLSHPNTKVVSYLLGTMHAQSDSAYTYYPKARNALSKVHKFVAEIDLSNPELSSISKVFQIQDNGTIKDYLNKRKYQKIRKHLLKSFNVDIEDFITFQPIFIINQLVSSVLPIVYPRTLDAQLFENAKELNLEIGGLESLNDQFVIVSKLEIKDQVKQLKELSRNPSSFRRKN